MSREKQSTGRLTAEKKKFGKIRRILWLIGLALIAFLLIIAIVFHAPWKVTALLIILLLVLSLLPESYRKWFWLSSAAILLTLVIWVLLPEDNEDFRPYTFDEEIAGHESKFAVSEEENAATIYNKLIQDYNSREWRLRFLPEEAFNRTSTEPWLSRDHPELIRWIRTNEAKITDLPQAWQLKTCRFPSNFEISPTDKLIINRYFALKSWALLLLLSGNNDMAEGRPNEAFSKYIYAIQIADHLNQQKRIIDFLMGFGVEGLILPALNRFVIENGLNEKQLQLILDIHGNIENNWSSDFAQCLEYDKLFFKNTFCSLLYQTNSKGHIRFSRDPAAAIWPRWRHRRAMAETFWPNKSMKTYAILAWFLFPSTPQKAAKIIDPIFGECNAMTSPDFAWDEVNIEPPSSLELNCRFWIRFYANQTTRFYGGFHDIYLKRLAQRRALRLLIAIKQYNTKNSSWPNDLNAIKSSAPADAFIDPVNNDSFVYKLTDESFTLYSKGKNNIDNNGVRDKWDFTDTGPDDILIWPPKGRYNNQINITDGTSP